MNKTTKLKLEAENLTVLYVEDENDTREQISEILQLFFKDVFIACNGQEGLNIYNSNKKIDLIMTDLTMPIMDGLTFIKKIREVDIYQHVIVLTAHNSSENLMATIDLQLDGFLLKPMRMEKMVELLLKVLHIINLEKKEILELR